ncbi:hypothetical protein PSTEL_15300 [Paenibacillus stellifer]|uniref:Peptidase C-terminal archaeal/bacterial domain-containing protein n=1 Tax=Paenibacillus stellifer TaxID=169760 RepID=A0A089LYA3_9BACL|nr:PPC domain-containing protein [Paenibacillus stellifer]AIQ64248.1 hypothetical protein PSTEL_15300 [Paenibacillus stellifer]
MSRKTTKGFKAWKGALLLLLVTAIFMGGHGSVNAETAQVVDQTTGQSVSEIKMHTLTTGDTIDMGKRGQYEINLSSDVEELVVPIKAEAAGVFQVFLKDDTQNIDVEFYSDAACTSALDYNSNNAFGVIPKAGTYYVKFVNSYGDYGAEDVISLKADFSCQLFPDVTELKADNWQAAGITDYTKPVYYKVSVPATVLLEVDFQAENTNSNITLCDSSKKAITDSMTIASTEGKKALVVKKGTYYLKVSTNAWWVRVKASAKGVSDSSGVSKNSAAALKLGTAKSGVFFLEDKTSASDWFKFTLTKPTKVDLVVSGNVSAGYIKYEVTSSVIDGTLSGYLSDVGNVDKTKLVYYKGKKLYESLPAGTYYVRLYKSSAKTCGNYFVKVVQR